jgi:hypothetical protein
MELDISLEGTGWLCVRIAIGERGALVLASDVADDDALAELAGVTADLLDGATEATLRFDAESRRWCWLCERRGDDLRVRVLSTAVAGDDAGEWSEQMDASCSVRAFAVAVLATMRSLPERYPGPILGERWRDRGFPDAALARIAASLARAS